MGQELLRALKVVLTSLPDPEGVEQQKVKEGQHGQTCLIGVQKRLFLMGSCSYTKEANKQTSLGDSWRGQG